MVISGIFHHQHGGRGASAPWHRHLPRGVEGEILKINSGLSLFFFFPCRAHPAGSGCDVGAHRGVPVSPTPAFPVLRSWDSSNSPISSSIPLGTSDMKGAAFIFHLLRGLLINTVGKYPPSNYDKHLEGTVSF